MLQLKKEYNYTLKVVKVVNSRKTFNSSVGKKHVNDITFTDGKETVTCEYNTMGDSQDTFVEGQIGVFKVVFSKHEGTSMATYEIEPVGAPSEWNTPQSGGVDPVATKSSNGNVSGQKATFALAYAKDVMIEWMSLSGVRPDSEAFKQELFSLADEMYNYLDQKTR